MDWLRGSKQGEARRLIALLGDATRRDSAARDLLSQGAGAVPALVDALQTQDDELRRRCQQILARIPAAADPLRRTLREGHPILRGRAAEVFAISRDRSAVPDLLHALQGEFFTVRSRAALALGAIRDPQAVAPLLHALKDSEAEVRAAACTALGQLREPSTFDEVAGILLDDPILEVRQAAARALGDTEHPAALPYLMEALHDSFWWYERAQAAGDLLLAIERMGPPAVPSIIEALGDREGTVRKFAAILLGKFGDQRAIEPLSMTLYDMHHEVGRASAESLARFGAPAVDILIEALSHPEMWIRIHSMGALAKIGDVRVVPALLRMLDDPEREVKKQVIHAMGNLKDPRVIRALQAVASNRGDRELHLLAKEVLARLGSA